MATEGQRRATATARAAKRDRRKSGSTRASPAAPPQRPDSDVPTIDRNAGELERHYARMAERSVELREEALVDRSHTAVAAHQKAVVAALDEYHRARLARLDEEARKADSGDMEERLLSVLRQLPPARLARLLDRLGGASGR